MTYKVLAVGTTTGQELERTVVYAGPHCWRRSCAPKEVRVRRGLSVGGSTPSAADTLTVKSDGTRTRDEVDVELGSPEVFQELTVQHTAGRIEKTRFVYQLPSGLRLGCDVFEQPKVGFMVAEVEFEPSVSSRELVTKEIQAAFPGRALRDATEDKALKHAALAVVVSQSATAAGLPFSTAETAESPAAGGV
jgi:CYTH domain-containing protein